MITAIQLAVGLLSTFEHELEFYMHSVIFTY